MRACVCVRACVRECLGGRLGACVCVGGWAGARWFRELLGGGGPESVGWWMAGGVVSVRGCWRFEGCGRWMGEGFGRAGGAGGLAWEDSGSAGAVEMGTGCRAEGRRGTSERANASEHNERFRVNRGEGGALLVLYFFGRGKICGLSFFGF